MTTRHQPPAMSVGLTDDQIEEFGRELDEMRDEIFANRGERDRQYILTLIKIQRSMAVSGRLIIYAGLFLLPAWNHGLASWWSALIVIGLGTVLLSLAKIIENMEIGHNILHAQWDWMDDPGIQSNTWEWDHVCPSDQWMHSHNVVHHTWTNVMGKDRDIGYGMLRVTEYQRWHPFYIGQLLSGFLMVVFFEWFIALHDLEIPRLVSGKKSWAEARPMLRQIGHKVWRQVVKDYIAWPLAAALVWIPISFQVPVSPFLIFGLVAAANAVANIIRNVWTNLIIFCGHFPAGVHHFRKEQVENESRAHWYVRQMLGSCNIGGGKLFHIMSGNLSHQIEHHLFPDMPSNRYPEIAPRVRALAARYGLDYNTGSFLRQLGTTWMKLARLSLPGPTPQPSH